MGDVLKTDLQLTRSKLVKQYTKNGTIRFDVATGLAFYEDDILQQRVKYIKQYELCGNLIVDNCGVPILKKVIDFEKVAEFNKSEGIVSGSMKDALHQRGYKKVVELYADDFCLRWGTIIMGETPMLLKIMDDIDFIPKDLYPLLNSVDGVDGVKDSASSGLVHAIKDNVETIAYGLRGQYKDINFRGDADFLGNPISLWSHTDVSHLSTSLFGINALIQMFGENQLIDLCGHTISLNEEATTYSGFSSLIVIGDGFFAGTTSKISKNIFIYNSSINKGIVGRSCHFGIVCNKGDCVLVDNITIGDVEVKNKAPPYASMIMNMTNNVVMCNCIQETLSKYVPKSSLGLNWYSDLRMTELLFGLCIRVEEWDSHLKTKYLWLKWTDIEDGSDDVYGNGKTTPYAEVKTLEELALLIGDVEKAGFAHQCLIASMESYKESSKNADDQAVQLLTTQRREEILRSTNLVAANALDRTDNSMYSDATQYGVRAGSAHIGIEKVASTSIEEQYSNIYVLDCEFGGMTGSFMECVGLANNAGLMKSFNGMSLRVFGYSNHNNPVAGVAAATMLLCPEYYAKMMNHIDPSLMPGSYPYTIKNEDGLYALDTARMAYDNAPSDVQQAWGHNKCNLFGLYTGNDVVEGSLATLTAYAVLQDVFPTSAAYLNSINNSQTDIGILAWRRSMMLNIDACTANHIGLKGGYYGDLSDRNEGQSTHNTCNDGEIYPWCVSCEQSCFIQAKIDIVKSFYLRNSAEEQVENAMTSIADHLKAQILSRNKKGLLDKKVVESSNADFSITINGGTIGIDEESNTNDSSVISCKTPSTFSIQLTVSPYDTIDDVLEKLSLEENHSKINSANEQNDFHRKYPNMFVKFGDKFINNTDTLRDVGISDGANLDLYMMGCDLLLIEFPGIFHKLQAGKKMYIKLVSEEIIQMNIVKVLSGRSLVMNYNRKLTMGECYNAIIDTVDSYGCKVAKKIVDKDQDYFNSTDKVTHDRSKTLEGYLAAAIPKPSHTLFQFALELIDETNPLSGFKLVLIHSDDRTQVTYKECADMLGFSQVGKTIIPDIDAPVKYDIIPNLDGQNHVYKGTIGIRYDNINCSGIKNCIIKDIKQLGFMPEVNIIGGVNEISEFGAWQASITGSKVNDIRGININSCNNIKIDNVEMSNFTSLGNICGTDLFGVSNDIVVKNMTFRDSCTPTIFDGGEGDSFKFTGKVWEWKACPPQEIIGLNICCDVINESYSNIVTTNTCGPIAIDIRHDKCGADNMSLSGSSLTKLSKALKMSSTGLLTVMNKL